MHQNLAKNEIFISNFRKWPVVVKLELIPYAVGEHYGHLFHELARIRRLFDFEVADAMVELHRIVLNLV